MTTIATQAATISKRKTASLKPTIFETASVINDNGLRLLAIRHQKELTRIKANSSSLSSLIKIAIKAYGKEFKKSYPESSEKNAWKYWVCIYYYNVSIKGRIFNPDRIYPGEEFLIPPLSYINEFAKYVSQNKETFKLFKWGPDFIKPLKDEHEVQELIDNTGIETTKKKYDEHCKKALEIQEPFVMHGKNYQANPVTEPGRLDIEEQQIDLPLESYSASDFEVNVQKDDFFWTELIQPAKELYRDGEEKIAQLTASVSETVKEWFAEDKTGEDKPIEPKQEKKSKGWLKWLFDYGVYGKTE